MTLPPSASCHACDYEFRRRLSAKGAKPESKNRCKSDLGHVGIWVAGYGMVFGIISPTTARSATNDVPKCNVGISNGHCLGTILIFQRLITWPILRMRSTYLVISPILMGRFGSNLLFGTSCYVSDTRPPSDSCLACANL